MHKMKYLIISVVFLAAGVSFGASDWTNESEIDSLWSTAGNWNGGVPSSSSDVYIGLSSLVVGPTIDSTVTAVGGWTVIGMGHSIILTMTGGSLNLSSLTIGERGNCTGTLNMSGGIAAVTGYLVVGAGTTGTNTGILTMSGNASFTIGDLMVGDAVGATGTIQLNDSAVLTVQNTIFFRDSTTGHPSLDIRSGAKFTVPVSQLSSVTTYIAAGWITGYGSKENVVVTTIGSQLEITASLDTCADIINAGLKFNSDLNGDCVVNFKDFSILSDEWLTESEYGAQPFFDVAVPQGTITVDGVISSGEWDGAVWNIMDQPYDGTVDDVTEAKWTAKWNGSLNLLYVVVTVADTHHVLVNSYTDWYTNDSVEIYVDFPNAGTVGYNSDYAYAQQYVGGISNVVGNEWLVFGANYPLPSGAVVAYQALKSGNQLTYEIALRPYSYLDINVPANSVVKTLVKGDVMGLDVVIGSNNGSSFGMLTGKVNIAGKFYNATALMKAKLVQ